MFNTSENKILKTDIGTIYIVNDLKYIELNLKNIKGILKYKKKIFWTKKIVQIDTNNFVKKEEIADNLEISKWYQIISKNEVINYLKYFRMYFISQDYPFSDRELYYEIKSLKVFNKENICKIEFSKKDIQLLVNLIDTKTWILLKIYNVSLLEMYLNNVKYDFQKNSVLSFSEYLINNNINKITLVFDSEEHMYLITYPVLNMKDDVNIVNFFY